MVAGMADDDGRRFDPRGPELVYMLVADDIAAKITRGELAPGDRLPGEAAMALEYGVARMTAARAVRELRERGLVRTVIGKGSYVEGRESSDRSDDSGS
jgi:GntR family transcriptional regulator